MNDIPLMIFIYAYGGHRCGTPATEVPYNEVTWLHFVNINNCSITPASHAATESQFGISGFSTSNTILICCFRYKPICPFRNLFTFQSGEIGRERDAPEYPLPFLRNLLLHHSPNRLPSKAILNHVNGEAQAGRSDPPGLFVYRSMVYPFFSCAGTFAPDCRVSRRVRRAATVRFPDRRPRNPARPESRIRYRPGSCRAAEYSPCYGVGRPAESSAAAPAFFPVADLPAVRGAVCGIGGFRSCGNSAAGPPDPHGGLLNNS